MTSKQERLRINLTPTQELFDYLEDWASQEMRPIASLALYLLTREVSRAIESGEYKPRVASPSAAMTAYIQSLAGKGEIDQQTLEAVAEATGIEIGKLRNLKNKRS